MSKGTITNRGKFLKNIRGKIGGISPDKPVEKPDWTVNPQRRVMEDFDQDQLVEVLEKQCHHIHTDFFLTNSESLQETLDQVLASYQTRSIVYSSDNRFHTYQLPEFFKNFAKKPEHEVFKWNDENSEESISFSERADVGITFSDITLAESGTIVLFNRKGQGRSVSLLPKDYIAIVPKSTIVPRMTQATDYVHQQVEKGEEISSCINFITGPSNSADIEMNLVVGVHGPIRAAYIVVEDK